MLLSKTYGLDAIGSGHPASAKYHRWPWRFAGQKQRKSLLEN
jgi:hypothetical protein